MLAFTLSDKIGDWSSLQIYSRYDAHRLVTTALAAAASNGVTTTSPTPLPGWWSDLDLDLITGRAGRHSE